jgi:hypothetical protein
MHFDFQHFQPMMKLLGWSTTISWVASVHVLCQVIHLQSCLGRPHTQPIGYKAKQDHEILPTLDSGYTSQFWGLSCLSAPSPLGEGLKGIGSVSDHVLLKLFLGTNGPDLEPWDIKIVQSLVVWCAPLPPVTPSPSTHKTGTSSPSASLTFSAFLKNHLPSCKLASWRADYGELGFMTVTE